MCYDGRSQGMVRRRRVDSEFEISIGDRNTFQVLSRVSPSPRVLNIGMVTAKLESARD